MTPAKASQNKNEKRFLLIYMVIKIFETRKSKI